MRKKPNFLKFPVEKEPLRGLGTEIERSHDEIDVLDDQNYPLLFS